MYQKFQDLFGEYYWDLSNKICMIPAFNAMELADDVLFKNSREVEF